jgi:phosphatidylinositol alpha-1,6-mannosyltransferase
VSGSGEESTRRSGSGGSAPGVLIVTLDFPPRVGGIQILALRLAQSFPTLRATVVAPTSPGAAEFDAGLPITVLRVPVDPGRSRIGKLLCLVGMLVWSVLAVWRARPRVTLCSHVLVAPIGRIVRRLFGVPYVVYVHADELIGLGGARAAALHAADGVLADSRYSLDLAVRVGAVPARVRVIGQGVDAPPALAEAASTPVGAAPTVLSVARMDELYKGHDVMIRSLPLIRARVPDVRLVLIGDGTFRGHHERLAASLGVADRVLFLGRVPDAERDRWLATCDVFAMPSRANALDGAGEGFGIAYVEAGAYGKPVLGGRVGGTLDSVVDGVTGLLVDPESVHEVAEGLLQILTDRELAARLGHAGRQRALTSLGWDEIGRQVEAVLQGAAS